MCGIFLIAIYTIWNKIQDFSTSCLIIVTQGALPTANIKKYFCDRTLKLVIRINEKCILQSLVMSQDLHLNWHLTDSLVASSMLSHPQLMNVVINQHLGRGPFS